MNENLLLIWAVFASIVAVFAGIWLVAQSRKTADANGRTMAVSNEKAQLDIRVAALLENERSSGQTIAKLNEDGRAQSSGVRAACKGVSPGGLLGATASSVLLLSL